MVVGVFSIVFVNTARYAIMRVGNRAIRPLSASLMGFRLLADHHSASVKPLRSTRESMIFAADANMNAGAGAVGGTERLE